MSQELAKQEDLIFSPENITKETIKKYLCKLASDQELIMGLQICKEFKLNPLKREVYFIKYGEEPMQVVLGYEVYLKRADRTGKYAGLKTWTEGTVKDGTLKGCAEVTVKGWEKVLYHECYYSEYVQRKKDGTINKFWSQKPITMIKKVTVAQAFKLAFPDEFAGMPGIAEEMGTDDIVDVEVDHTKSRVEQIVEQQFVTNADLAPEVKDAPKDSPKEEPKKETKKSKAKDPSKNNEDDTKGTETLPKDHKVIIGLIDNTIQEEDGSIKCFKKTKTPVVNPNTGKSSIKYSFLIVKDGVENRYGTWDESLVGPIQECIDNRILVKFEYKERKNEEGKLFNDIVSFRQATADEVKL